MEITVNDRIVTETKVLGYIKSRKGQHINSPSAREGQTTVFYELGKGLEYGKAHEIDAPALVKTDGGRTSRLNPVVISAIQDIVK